MALQALTQSLDDHPHIAAQVCYALAQLAAGIQRAGNASMMSPYFKDVVQRLLTLVGQLELQQVLLRILGMPASSMMCSATLVGLEGTLILQLSCRVLRLANPLSTASGPPGVCRAAQDHCASPGSVNIS